MKKPKEVSHIILPNPPLSFSGWGGFGFVLSLLRLYLGEEFFCVDEEALVFAFADHTGLVPGCDREDDAAAVDLGDLGLGADLHVHGRRGVVGDLELRADAALPCLIIRREGIAGSQLHHRRHPRRREHLEAPRAHGRGGLVRGHVHLCPALCSDGNIHMKNSFQQIDPVSQVYHICAKLQAVEALTHFG